MLTKYGICWMVIFLFAVVAQGASVTWDGSCGDVFWFTCCDAGGGLKNTNWSLGTSATCDPTVPTNLFPQPADDVDIGANHVILGCCGTSSVHSFINSGTFEETSGGNLQIATTATYNGPLLLHQAGLTGGHHSVNGGLTVSGCCGSGGLSIVGGAIVDLNSNTTWTGVGGVAANIGIEHGCTVNNMAGKVFDAQADAALQTTNTMPPAPPVFNNAGTFRKSAGTTTLTANAPGQFNNSGLVDVQVGTIEVHSDGTHTGAFQVAGGAVLRFFDGTSTLNVGTTFAGAGTVQLDTFAILTIPSGVTIEIPKFKHLSNIRNGTGTLRITGSEEWNGGTLTDAGITEIPASATLAISGIGAVSITGGYTVNNAGTTTWTNVGKIDIANGIFNNLAGALFEAQNDATVDGNGGTPRQINNAGTFRKSAGASNSATRFVIGAQLNNSGLVDIQVGNLSLQGSDEVQSGTMQIAAGATISFADGTHSLQNGASFTGNGLALIQAGTVTLAAGTNIPAVHFEAQGGNLVGQGSMTVSKTFDWTSQCIISGSGALTIPAGATMHVNDSAGGGGLRRFDLGHVLNNAGSVIWSGNCTIDSLESSTINNQPSGNFDIQNDQVLSLRPGTFNNAGFFHKSAGAGETFVQFGGGGTLINTGTIQVDTGTLRFDPGFSQTAGQTILSGGEFGGAFNQTITFAGGSIRGTGNINVNVLNNTGATISPGSSPGTINITGNPTGDYTQGAGGHLAIELGGLTAGIQYDVLNVAGTATLGGTLDVSRINCFALALEQTFTILNAAVVTGTFAHVSVSSFPPGLGVNVIYNPTNVVLTIVSAPYSVTCPANKSISANSSGQAPVPDFIVLVTTDNCGLPSLSQNPAAGTLVGVGNTTVTISAIDGAGHTSQCSLTLTVTSPPGPGAVEVESSSSDSGTGGSGSSNQTGGGTGNCGACGMGAAPMIPFMLAALCSLRRWRNFRGSQFR